MTKVDVRAVGLMFGCAWSVCVLVLGLACTFSGRGSRAVSLFATVYKGYKATLPGSLIGAGWGFMDGVISGIVIAWIYNRVVC